MATYLHHIETVVPSFSYQQTALSTFMKSHVAKDRRSSKLIGHIYKQSNIETRHSVLSDFSQNPLFVSEQKSMLEPSTKTRNELYTQEARKLFTCAAHNALARVKGVTEFDVTHVITVSCTGFFAPGPDYYVVQDLGLDRSTQRFHIGFMGCYAAFPALKMAQAFCEADENAVVLVISVELCTLHLQAKNDVDSLLSASVFADGGAAAIVSKKKPQGTALKFDQFSSTLVPEGEADMAWTIGNTGFEMILSSYVPKLLESNIAGVVEPLLNSMQLSQEDIDYWAIHPGGRAILDKVRDGLNLDETDLRHSRDTLKHYGNMSSSTIFFVFKSMMQAAESGQKVFATAFGPGLTVETALMTAV